MDFASNAVIKALTIILDQVRSDLAPWFTATILSIIAEHFLNFNAKFRWYIV